MSVGASLTSVFDYAWTRLLARVAGMTDDEYLWEPVEGCWTLRPAGSGHWVPDGSDVPQPEPAPVTTIAWRLAHVADALGSFAERRFGAALRAPAPPQYPGSVEALPGFLDRHYSAWMRGMAGLEEDEWGRPLGPAFGPFADDSTLDLALHVLDELVHHGAEVGVLRDLYPHRPQAG